MVVISKCIPPVNTVPHDDQIIVHSTRQHITTRWSEWKLVRKRQGLALSNRTLYSIMHPYFVCFNNWQVVVTIFCVCVQDPTCWLPFSLCSLLSAPTRVDTLTLNCAQLPPWPWPSSWLSGKTRVQIGITSVHCTFTHVLVWFVHSAILVCALCWGAFSNRHMYHVIQHTHTHTYRRTHIHTHTRVYFYMHAFAYKQFI